MSQLEEINYPMMNKLDLACIFLLIYPLMMPDSKQAKAQVNKTPGPENGFSISDISRII